VTTVRDLGAPAASLPLPPPAPGSPRVLAAGPLLTVPGGYPIPVFGSRSGGVVRGPESARALVRRLASRGAAVIKVAVQYGFPVLSRAELEAIVDEAHHRGLRVTAHVGDVEAARFAFETGVDELAHMPCGGPDPALMRQLAEADVEIVGTFHVIELVVGCPQQLPNARAFVRAGGTLLYGSDYGSRAIPPGIDVVELRRMISAGLSPLEAIVNATSRAGAELDVEGVGTLAEGAPADIVAFDGNPLRDVGELQQPSLVVVRGRVIVRRQR
jgi:imidazolonepropionase-like amidohydrolase